MYGKILVCVALLVQCQAQLRGAVNTSPGGLMNILMRKPIGGSNGNAFSAIGGVNGLAPNGRFGSVNGGLAFDSARGHGLSLTGAHVPGFGNQLTGAGRFNLVNSGPHKLDANAFITRNMPTIPNVPNFNTQGGSLNYLFNNKLGGSLGVARTDLLKRTDYSAMGNLNLFRNPSSSLDLNAGVSKSVSPFMPNSRWQPSGGLTFSRFF